MMMGMKGNGGIGSIIDIKINDSNFNIKDDWDEGIGFQGGNKDINNNIIKDN
jgi:hypothetical protein